MNTELLLGMAYGQKTGGGSGGGTGTTNYAAMNNKPKINGVTLDGNKTTAQLGIKFDDLSDKPEIPAAYDDTALTERVEALEEAGGGTAAATSVAWDNVTGKPAIPADTNDLTNGAGYQTAQQVETAITGKGYQTAAQISATISDAIDGLIDGAPETYNTLKEIADYIAEDKTGAAAVTQALANKVDKEIGKGLSANDYTTAEKTKLAALPTNADLQTALNGKQAAGNYAQNGGAPGYPAFGFTTAHVMQMKRANNTYSNGVSIMGVSEADADGVTGEWFRYERNSGEIQSMIRTESTGWEQVHKWKADEDTNWITEAIPDLGQAQIYYRKKNGHVSIVAQGAINKNLVANANQLIGTLPAGFRPGASYGVPVVFRQVASPYNMEIGYVFVQANGQLNVVTSSNKTAGEWAIVWSTTFPI